MTVLTFPSNPIIGQQYDAPNGIQYVFDGVKWTVLTVASTSAAVTDAVQDRVAPMFVNGDHTGITFTYNAATNVISADVTAVNGNRLINGNKTLTLESNGNITLSNTGTISDSVEIAGTPGIFISRTFQTPDDAISSNFGTNTIKLLLSDVDGAQIANYIGRGIAVGAWFNTGGSTFPMTGCVQVSTGIWTITATGIGNRFTTFAANPLKFIHTGVTPNTYQNFAQYALTIPAATTISKGGEDWKFAADGATTFPTGGQIANYPGGVGVSDNSWFVTPGGEDGNGGVSSQDGQQYIQINNNLPVEIGTSYGTENESIWRFDNSGNLILPNGQSIGSGSLDGIKMTTDRGTVLFGNSPECVPTLLTHFHIMKDDPANVDLFLGDDNNYVKLPGNSETAYGVEIGTNVGSAYTWRFGTDGVLTFPDGSIQTTAYTGDGGGAVGTFFVVANDDGTVSKSTDGVTWTAGVDLVQGIDRVATDGVTVAMIQSSQLSWTTFAGLEASTYVSGTSNINDSIGERSISWNQIDYAGGYFVAVGSYTPIVDGFTQGVYGYSTDGRVWTFATVDQTVVEFFGNDPVDSNWEFSDVDYNGVGWMFSVSDNGPSNPQGGGVYITDLTAAVTSARCFSMSLTYDAAWNGSAWYMEGDNSLAGVNTNLDPRNGTFNGPIDPWDTAIQDLGISAGDTVELAGGNGYIAASDSEGHVAWSDDNGVTWQIVTPIPYTRTISAITQASPAVVTSIGRNGDTGEKVIISGSSVSGYNGTFYWDSTSNSLYTDQALTTEFDTTGLAPFTGTATLTWSHGEYIDAMDYINGYFYIGNDDEQIARTTNFVSWTIVDDQNNNFDYWNDIAGFVNTGTTTNTLVNGAQEFTLNADGSVTFPDGSIQTTAYTGSGTSGDANIWVQTFVSDTPATDVVQVASSVEYDSVGNIIALFNHLDPGNSTYYSVGKYTSTGTRIWTARFSDDFNTDGWGLAVDSASGFVYIAGQTSSDGGQTNATLTKISGADGTIEWSKLYDFGFDSQSAVVDVASDGNPVMVGYAFNINSRYVATTKVDEADGSIIWSRALDGQDDEQAYGMAVGPSGEIVVVGYMAQLGFVDSVETAVTEPVSNVNWVTNNNVQTNGVNFNVTFSAGVPTITINSDSIGNRSVGQTFATLLGSVFGGTNGIDDMVVKVATLAQPDLDDHMLVVKYDSLGALEWQKAVLFDNNYDSFGADADIDSEGNVYVTGMYEADIAGPVSQLLNIFKLNSSGVKQWSRRLEGNCGGFASSIVVGPDDHLYLSATTFAGTELTYDVHAVLAKYEFDGTVAWQRLIDYTDGFAFGSFFFGSSSGGSNLAVKQDYVAVGLGFGSDGGGPGDVRAAVAQVSTAGDLFTVGSWDFKQASFTGLLSSDASDIEVLNANKVNTDNASNIDTIAVTPMFDNSNNFLIGTLFTASGNESLVNGAYSVTLENNGTVTLPAGGTITEGYVTSNPTIQLTPASPDVASQKLVIKGGGSYSYTDNGININYYNNTALVGETPTFYIYSPTYADQTLYWWIYPEGAGIATPESGTVVLDGSGGTISFELDSDDYEFTLRVSPENNNYGPGVIGVESGLINATAPTFDTDYHLHLTTGDLTETSIILGTDNHNVRTDTDGTIQVTTTYYGAVSSVASVNSQGGYNTGTYTGLTTTGGTGSGLTVNATSTGGYIDVITLVNPGKGYTDDDVITLVGGDGLGCTFVVNVPVGTSEWTFAADGSITFPTQTTPDYANRSDSYTTGPTLQLADNGTDDSVVITGPATTLASPYAKRLVIQGQPGWRGSNIGTTGTEGGDVYIWGGYGGEGSNYTGDGGDVKLRGGNGGQSGGYVRLESGLAKDGDGVGGFLDLNAGDATASGGIGGPVEIRGGRGVASGGAVNIHTATTNIFNNQWTFANDGSLTLPKNSSVSEVTPATGAAANITVIQVASSIANISFVSVPPAPILDYTIPDTDIVVDVNWNANGSEYYSPRFTVVDGGTGHTGGGQFGGGEVLTVPYADMGITTGGNWTWYVVDIASDLVLEAGLKDWTFAADGVITLPNSMTIGSYGTLGENAFLEIGGDDTRITIDNDGAPPGLYITTNATGGMAQRVWRFGPDGDITFPNNTIKNDNDLNISAGTSTVGISEGSLEFIGDGTLLLSPGVVVGGVGDTGYNPFTIDAWVKFSEDPATHQQFILGTADGNWNGFSLFVGDGQSTPSATKITVDCLGESNTQFDVPAITTGTWYHIAVARNSSGIVSVWLNGVRSTTGAIGLSGGPVAFTGLTDQIGSWSYNNTTQMLGNVGQVRIVTDNNIYDPNDSTITVPTADLQEVTGTQLLLLMKSSDQYGDDTGNNTLSVYDMAGSTTLPAWTTNAPTTVIPTTWTFGTDGSLTLPGAVVKSTVAKTGVILPTTTGIPLTLSGGMTGLSLADGTYGPVTIGGVTFSVTVTGGGISGYINISSTTPYAVYDTIGQLTSAALGDTPGQTTNVGVDSVVQETPTALDLTKSVNKLTDGDYTLADGVEGQIMYLVRQNGSTAHNVTVANVRLDGTDYTDVSFTPFTDGTDPTNMATLIFTDSAWQSMGGVWNFT